VPQCNEPDFARLPFLQGVRTGRKATVSLAETIAWSAGIAVMVLT
jgi:hypothetical protein